MDARSPSLLRPGRVLRALEQKVAAHAEQARTFVTLAYAQSLDGSLARMNLEPVKLSCDEAWGLTHGLRSVHDGILVGVGTVLTDDPRLDVRLVEGPNPQPVVLDSACRTPPDCRLVRGACPPWILTLETAERERIRRLERAGAEVLVLPDGGDGRLDIAAVLKRLHLRGMQTLMVEGGCQTVISFLEAQLVDYLVLTICPRFVGGATLGASGVTAELSEVITEQLGSDLIVAGAPA